MRRLTAIERETTMKTYITIVGATIIGLTLSACATVTPTKDWYVSHAVASPQGDLAPATGWHSCKGGGMCREGYACVENGCEWCGGGDGINTRCTNGND